MSSQRIESYNPSSRPQGWRRSNRYPATRQERRQTSWEIGQIARSSPYYPSPRSSNNMTTLSQDTRYSFDAPNIRQMNSHDIATATPTPCTKYNDETRIRISDIDPPCSISATPGAKSHPIKIEDSPKTSKTSKPSFNNILVSHPQGPAATSDPQANGIEPANPNNDHNDINPSELRNGQQTTTHLSLPPELVISSIEVSCIVGSVDAAAAFLRCLEPGKKRWLKSADSVLSPDIPFWRQIVTDFNAGSVDRLRPNRHTTSNWLTANVIATVLSSQAYGACANEQLSKKDNSDPDLLTAIKKIHSLAGQKKWERWPKYSDLMSEIEAFMRSEEQAVVLSRMPQSIEEREELIQTLAQTMCNNKVGKPTIVEQRRPEAKPLTVAQPTKKRPRAQTQTSCNYTENHVNGESFNVGAMAIRKRAETSGKTMAPHHKHPKSTSLVPLPPFATANSVFVPVTPPSSTSASSASSSTDSQKMSAERNSNMNDPEPEAPIMSKAGEKKLFRASRAESESESSDSSSGSEPDAEISQPRTGNQRKKGKGDISKKVFRAVKDQGPLLYRCLLLEKTSEGKQLVQQLMRVVSRNMKDPALTWKVVRQCLLNYHGKYPKGTETDVGEAFEPLIPVLGLWKLTLTYEELQDWMKKMFESKLHRVFRDRLGNGKVPDDIKELMFSPQAFKLFQGLYDSVMEPGRMTPYNWDDYEEASPSSIGEYQSSGNQSRSPTTIWPSVELDHVAARRGSDEHSEEAEVESLSKVDEVPGSRSPGITPQAISGSADLLEFSPMSNSPPSTQEWQASISQPIITDGSLEQPYSQSPELGHTTPTPGKAGIFLPRPFRDLTSQSPYVSRLSANQSRTEPITSQTVQSRDRPNNAINELDEELELLNSWSDAPHLSPHRGLREQGNDRATILRNAAGQSRRNAGSKPARRQFPGQPTPENLRKFNAEQNAKRKGPAKPKQVPSRQLKTPSPAMKRGQRGNTIPPFKFYRHGSTVKDTSQYTQTAEQREFSLLRPFITTKTRTKHPLSTSNGRDPSNQPVPGQSLVTRKESPQPRAAGVEKRSEHGAGQKRHGDIIERTEIARKRRRSEPHDSYPQKSPAKPRTGLGTHKHQGPSSKIGPSEQPKEAVSIQTLHHSHANQCNGTHTKAQDEGAQRPGQNGTRIDNPKRPSALPAQSRPAALVIQQPPRTPIKQASNPAERNRTRKRKRDRNRRGAREVSGLFVSPDPQTPVIQGQQRPTAARKVRGSLPDGVGIRKCTALRQQRAQTVIGDMRQSCQNCGLKKCWRGSRGR
ncbi:hypothetical protein F5Y16DRAFT_397706 [Xylariaceae sp. FL0255]|nr:hypothetical protein F5Y16DRAFT_397706 [Xylariaceae sp. FL0255]